MRPKTKASQLYNKYKPLCKDVKHMGFINGQAIVKGDEDLNHYSAKICALVTVDEVLCAIQDLPIDEVNWDYWIEVKQEIEKL